MIDSDEGSSPLTQFSFSDADEFDSPRPTTTADRGVQTYFDDDDVTLVESPKIITHENAQHILPPDACIFVANLPRSMADAVIRKELEDAFVRFGTVFVKVRRDNTDLPVAFVQYTDREDATRALNESQEIYIGDRAVRVEKAKCDRTLFCSARHRHRLNEADIREIIRLVEPYGEIESTTQVPAGAQSLYYLPNGIWLRFKLYGACQDAFKDLYRHRTYRFELFRDRNTQFRFRPYPASKVPPLPSNTLLAAEYAGVEGIESTRQYGSIIFVDGLPITTTESQLEELFRTFGTIIKTSIHKCPRQHRTGDLIWYSGYIGFAEEYAGPAVQTFSVRHGFAMQDATQLVWCHLAIELIYIASQPFNAVAMQAMDFGQYHQYLHSLPNPALVPHPRFREQSMEIPRWTPTDDLAPFFGRKRFKASAPGLGVMVPAQEAHTHSTYTFRYLEVDSEAFVTPYGRAYGYGMAQRLYTRADLPLGTPGPPNTALSPKPPSGMSPLRP
ncbi:hypothetical protein B9Z65_1400 [Elsinoe australis]|uniref:RRM domain-containing protein n=1 Tax=Elsinoe australis TaxID=40998 RepID=A0A2P7YFS6_9PEZI|nr:hypothetical protein B9Z65_1400 [Elsinoe australis]